MFIPNFLLVEDVRFGYIIVFVVLCNKLMVLECSGTDDVTAIDVVFV